jgi:hypothetical protein
MTLTRGPWLACAVLFAVGLAGAAPVPDEADLLRYRFKEGDKVKYVLQEKTVIEIDLGTGPAAVETTTTLDLAWRVAKVGKDGKYTVTQTIERLRMEFPTTRGKLNYDSQAKAGDDPNANQWAGALKVFTGAEMTLVLDGRGRIDSLKYSEKLAKDVAGLPLWATGSAAALSEDNVRRMLGECLPVLPEKAPARGQSWDSKLQAKFAGEVDLTLENKHTYEGAEKRGDGKLDKIVTKPTVTASAVRSKIELLKQDVSGTSYFDRAAGRVRETAFTQKIEVKSTQGGQSVTLKGTTDVTLKLADKEK